MADDLGNDGLENQAKGAAKEVGGKLRNAASGAFIRSLAIRKSKRAVPGSMRS